MWKASILAEYRWEPVAEASRNDVYFHMSLQHSSGYRSFPGVHAVPSCAQVCLA